jgi:hypothetical protein
METEDDNWKDITMGRYLNSGGYGVGYIFDAIRSLPFDAINTKPAITPLLGLENPEKLTKIKRHNMVLFHIPTTNESALYYSWRAEDVLGQKGVLKIHRIIYDNEHTGKKEVEFRWDGEVSGIESIPINRVKDPHFVLDYIESCLNGKHSLPF